MQRIETVLKTEQHNVFYAAATLEVDAIVLHTGRPSFSVHSKKRTSSNCQSRQLQLTEQLRGVRHCAQSYRCTGHLEGETALGENSRENTEGQSHPEATCPILTQGQCALGLASSDGGILIRGGLRALQEAAGEEPSAL